MASETTQADKAVDDLRPSENLEEDNVPAGGSSDGEGGERTAREKLKKTSIAGLAQYSKSSIGEATGDHPLSESMTTDTTADPPIENGSIRGRPSKKRSFEDLQKDEQSGLVENGSIRGPDAKRSIHKRMRSRDVSGGNQQERGKFGDPRSPVQEESDDEGPGGAGILVDSQTLTDSNAQRSPEDKILEDKDTTDERTIGVVPETGLPSTSLQQSSQSKSTEQSSKSKESTLSPSSGFANASSTSPFGAVMSHPSNSKDPATTSTEPSTTSNSAFASSGLSAFASSEKSPFGASVTAQSTGGFGGGVSGFDGGASSGFGSGKPSSFGSGSTGFGGASTFGSKPGSGFGGTTAFGSTGAFGAAAAPRPFGGATSSFAGPAIGTSVFAKARPFGTKDKEDEEDDASADGEDDKQDDDDEKPDSRFRHQTVETGEEEEDTIFTCRAKLFHFEEKQWKERGVGTLKINVRYEEMKFPETATETENGDNDDNDLEGGITPMARRGRVLMRTDGVHRVVLNTPVFKEMNVGTKDGEEPTGRTMMLTGMEDGRPTGFQFRVGKEEVLKDFYYKIQELKAEL